MTDTTMDRRQFVTSVTLAGALMASGGLPLLQARAEGNGSGIDANTGPGEVKGVRGYLQDHALQQGEAPRQGPYTLTYDVVHWDWTPKNTDNSIVGTLEIRRKRGGVFSIAQDVTYAGIRNMLEAEIGCGRGPLRTLKQWDLVSRAEDVNGEAIPRLRTEESGRVVKGGVEIRAAKHHYGFETSLPLVSQWTVLDCLMREADGSSDIRFDLLQDLSLFKAGQRLVYAGPVEVPMKNGGQARLESYRQTGEGVLPTHYLIDDEGLPQLVTTMIMSWGLRAVA